MLKTEQNTTTMERRIRRAFRGSRHWSVCCIESFSATFEHDQWWVIVAYKEGHGDAEEKTFSVVDAAGSGAVDGFDFEEV